MTEAMTITPDMVQHEVESRGIRHWKLRECSICGVGLHYNFYDEQVSYQSACGCADFGNDEPRTYADVAKCFEIQTDPEVKSRMWADFLAAGRAHPAVTSA